MSSPSFGSNYGAQEMSNDYRRPSSRLTFEDAIEIWIRIIRGEYQSRIAADYDVNIGRISAAGRQLTLAL